MNYYYLFFMDKYQKVIDKIINKNTNQKVINNYLNKFKCIFSIHYIEYIPLQNLKIYINDIKNTFNIIGYIGLNNELSVNISNYELNNFDKTIFNKKNLCIKDLSYQIIYVSLVKEFYQYIIYLNYDEDIDFEF